MRAYIIPAMAQKDSHKDGGGQVGVITRTEPKTKKPSLYKVLLLNDDYTPMEFVVHVLQQFFSKSAEEATRIMLHVHQKGVGVCGVYTFDEEDRLAGEKIYYDRATVLRQFGVFHDDIHEGRATSALTERSRGCA